MNEPAAGSDDRRPLGARVERAVAERLARDGWTILARNWRHRLGELDIVALDGDALVVVEVRSRRGVRFGTPEESVDGRKRARLAALAEAYVAQSAWPGPWRIDVVAVNVGADGTLARYAHYRSAVGP